MKAALVTLQKKLKGYDEKIAELAHEKDRLLGKVGHFLRQLEFCEPWQASRPMTGVSNEV